MGGLPGCAHCLVEYTESWAMEMEAWINLGVEAEEGCTALRRKWAGRGHSGCGLCIKAEQKARESRLQERL